MVLRRFPSLIIAVVLSGCEGASVIRVQAFGTDIPDLAGVTLVSETTIPVAQNAIWVLQGVKYVTWDGIEKFSDAEGQFEVSRIEPVLWMWLRLDEVSTTVSAPGYDDLEVSGRHGQTLRAVLLRKVYTN
jgi:hypothetical protein